VALSLHVSAILAVAYNIPSLCWWRIISYGR